MEDGLHVADRWRIVRGTMQSLMIQGGSVLLVFAGNLLLVRFSDTRAYGLYVHVFNWVSVLGVLVMGGRDDLLLAQIPRMRGNPRGVRHLVRAANRWIAVAGVATGMGWIGLLHWVRIDTLSEHEDLFRLAAVAVLLTAALSLNQIVLQALDHIRSSQVVEKLARPLLLITGILLLHVSGTLVDARTLVILATGALAVCCGAAGAMGYRMLRRMPAGRNVAEGRAAGEAKEKGGVGPVGTGKKGKTTWFFLISLFYLLGTKITMLILPVFLPAKEIGIFNISYRFADLLIFPFFLMHTVLPQLFARHAEADRGYIQSLYSESNKLMSLLSLPLLAGILVAGPLLLRLFGPEFSAGYPALVYISVAQFLFALFGPANTILMMQDRERYAAGCLFAYVAMLAGASWWLIPVAGITGGALAILLSNAAYNVLLAVVVYRSCGVRSPFLGWMVKTR